MKKLIKSKIFWMLVVIAAGIGTYFGFENNWWMQTEPVAEEVVETRTEVTDDVEIIETIDSLEVVNTNTVETNE